MTVWRHASIPGRVERVLLAAALIVVSTPPAEGGRPRSSAPAPAFYDFHLETYLASEPMSAFSAQRAALRALTEREVDEFDWSPSGKEPAWFSELQSLRFVLPWLSSSPSDEDRASWWLRNWYIRHCIDDGGRAGWGNALACAQRALVLEFWLQQEERRVTRADEGTLGMLRDAIRLHQDYLALDKNFHSKSNAGVLEAIALRGTTHAAPAPGIADIATQRLNSVLEGIVSPRGAGVEHAAQYHFVVLSWLEAAAAFFEADGAGKAEVARLHECAARMRRAGYFLVDHADRVVQIGDSDSTIVPGFSQKVLREFPAPGEVYYDSLAGYAVYKAPPADADARYVVFRIQSGAIALPAHSHADALSLVVSVNGETILGDSGRFQYDSMGVYFASPPAHNTIFPEQFLWPTSRRMVTTVERASNRSSRREVAWWGKTKWNDVEASRGVRVPGDGPVVVVDDTLRVRPSIAPPTGFCWTWNAGNDVRRVTLVSTQTSAGEWVVETYRGARFRFRMTVSGYAGDVSVVLLRGATNPDLGWNSPAYGVRRPSDVVLAKFRPGAMMTVRTVIEPQE